MLPARIGIAALIATAAVAVAIQQRDWTRMPAQADAAAAATLVATSLEAGDVVRAYPWWYDDSRRMLGEAPVLVGRDLDPWDLHAYGRMWLLVPDSHAEQADDVAPYLRERASVQRFGSLDVQRGDIVVPDRVAWDAFHHFGDAIVTRRDADGEVVRECSTRREGEVHCGRIDPWIYVFAATREVDDTYRNCIQVNVAPDGERWVLRWDGVPRTPAVRIRAGNTLLATRSERGSPVSTRMFIDGEVVHTQETPILDNTYPETMVTTPPGGDTMTLEVEVAAEDHLDRFFCFRVQAFEPGVVTPGGMERPR